MGDALELPHLNQTMTGVMNRRASAQSNAGTIVQTVWTIGCCVVLFGGSALAQAPKPDIAQEDLTKLKMAMLSSNLDFVVWHLFATILAGFVVILLLRVASALQNARFLRHLAGAYSLVAAAHFGWIVTAIFKDRLATEALISHESGASALDAVQTVQAAWDKMDITLSFFSTFWLLLTWNLIAEFPKQGISKPFFVSATAILGLVLALLAVIVAIPLGAADKGTYAFIEIVDVASSAAVLFVIGLAFCSIYPRKIGIAVHHKHRLFGFGTGCFYMVWAISEPLWYLLNRSLLYSVFLFLVGYASMLATVIFCSFALEEKREYAGQADTTIR
jgi:hypothetical protein